MLSPEAPHVQRWGLSLPHPRRKRWPLPSSLPNTPSQDLSSWVGHPAPSSLPHSAHGAAGSSRKTAQVAQGPAGALRLVSPLSATCHFSGAFSFSGEEGYRSLPFGGRSRRLAGPHRVWCSLGGGVLPPRPPKWWHCLMVLTRHSPPPPLSASLLHSAGGCLLPLPLP